MSNEEDFKREYLSIWSQSSKEYHEAYKLWLWYFYQCELYDSKICTGSNEYNDYTPRAKEEALAVNLNAIKKRDYIKSRRQELKSQGVYITEEDWISAKNHFGRYKLKALEEEYKIYFGNE